MSNFPCSLNSISSDFKNTTSSSTRKILILFSGFIIRCFGSGAIQFQVLHRLGSKQFQGPEHGPGSLPDFHLCAQIPVAPLPYLHIVYQCQQSKKKGSFYGRRNVGSSNLWSS